MENSHANSSPGSWQNANDVLQTFSSLSRISKGNSLRNAENKKETTIKWDDNNYRSNESTYCTDSTVIPTLSMPYHSSQQIHCALQEEIPNGMGRGRVLRNLEKKFTENSLAELDKKIHNELSEINCVYSNDAIERHWASSSSPTEFPQHEVINTNEDPLDFNFVLAGNIAEDKGDNCRTGEEKHIDVMRCTDKQDELQIVEETNQVPQHEVINTNEDPLDFNFVLAVNIANEDKGDNCRTGEEKHIDVMRCTDKQDELQIVEETNQGNIVERKDKVEIFEGGNDVEVVEERELIEGLSTLSMETNNNRIETVDDSTVDTNKVEVVSIEDVTKTNTSDTKETAVSSEKISKKSKRKCRNLILLNLSSRGVAETVPKTTLKQPDAFLKPPVKSSYSAALGLNQPRTDGSDHGKLYGSMFSQADFPPL